jgi:hypothetical protein
MRQSLADIRSSGCFGKLPYFLGVTTKIFFKLDDLDCHKCSGEEKTFFTQLGILFAYPRSATLAVQSIWGIAVPEQR